jgi:hypothetical protein
MNSKRKYDGDFGDDGRRFYDQERRSSNNYGYSRRFDKITKEENTHRNISERESLNGQAINRPQIIVNDWAVEIEGQLRKAKEKSRELKAAELKTRLDVMKSRFQVNLSSLDLSKIDSLLEIHQDLIAWL